LANTFHWLALTTVLGSRKSLFKTLIEKFRSPERIFQAPLQELTKIEGVSSEMASAIKTFSDNDAIHREIDRLREKEIKFAAISEKDYPKNLLQIYDPPPFFYYQGSFREEDTLAVAIVGSRKATTYGVKTAERIGRELALRGFTIVSGMARGIDTAAHRGALQGGGRTIAVLGSGIDVIYPTENKLLFNELIQQGAVLSEFPLSTPPLPKNFPQRNRIISGLSLGVVVVEASTNSGSLITAKLALDQGREVFAVPGSINSLTSQGTNGLIKEGAKLVETVDDIIEELPQQLNFKNRMTQKALHSKPKVCFQKDKDHPSLHKALTITLKPEEEAVWNSISDEPKHIDTIILENQLKANAIYAILLNLEMKDLIQEHPGKYYSRIN
jgi:DNA processing protein